MVNAVIFDMDGLMFDTERLGKEAWLQIGTETGFAIDEAVLSRIPAGLPLLPAPRCFMNNLERLLTTLS